MTAGSFRGSVTYAKTQRARSNRRASARLHGLSVDGPPVSEPWEDDRLAHFLAMPVRALPRLRHSGEGPNYTRTGRVVTYLPSDILAWLVGQRAHSVPAVDPDIICHCCGQKKQHHSMN